MKALPLSYPQNCCPPSIGLSKNISALKPRRSTTRLVKVWAKTDDEGEGKGEAKKSKQSLFGSVAEALDFSAVRSSEDAQLLEEAREATRSGGKMNREQVVVMYRQSLLWWVENLIVSMRWS